MLCRFIKSLEKAFEPSMRAAALDGPKHLIPTIVEKNFGQMFMFTLTFLLEKNPGAMKIENASALPASKKP